MKKAEKILVSLALISILGKLANVTGFSAFVMISLFLLSAFYIVGTYFLCKTDNREKLGMQVVVSILTGIMLSTVVLSALFGFMRWPGNVGMLLSGIVPLVVISVIAILKFRSQPNFFKNILQRVVPIMAVALFMISPAKSALLNLQYRNHPRLVEAIEAAEEAPNDKNLKVARDVEYMRMQVNREQFLSYLSGQAKRDSLYIPYLEEERSLNSETIE